MQEQSRSLSRPLIIVIVLVFLAMVAGLYYLAVLRVQGKDYDAASANVEMMIAKATEFEALNENNALGPATVTKLQLANATQIVAAYNEALEQLRNSPAVTRNDTVAKAYAEVRQAAEEYGQTSEDFVVTLLAFSTIKQSCNIMLSQLSSITSLASLQSASTDCKQAVEDHASVPLKEFNDKYFLTYHENAKNLLDALETYYTAAESGADTQKQKAQELITSSIASIKTLNDDKEDYMLIANSDSPVESLKKLQAVIKKERS